MNNFWKIPRLKWSDHTDWRTIYEKQVPVIIEGLAKNWPCIADVDRKWINLAQLKNRIKNRDSVVAIEIGDHYMSANLKKANVSLLSYLDYLQSQASSGDSPRVYLAQQTLSEVEVLKEDVNIPEICLKTGKGHLYNSNLWLGGPQGSVSPCHYDPFNGLLVQIFGEKEVKLVHPQYSENLYPAYHTVQKNTSLVDFENPDLSIHGKFSEIEAYDDSITAGDAVFIPYKWWHYCKARNISCSVNYWWL